MISTCIIIITLQSVPKRVYIFVAQPLAIFPARNTQLLKRVQALIFWLTLEMQVFSKFQKIVFSPKFTSPPFSINLKFKILRQQIYFSNSSS